MINSVILSNLQHLQRKSHLLSEPGASRAGKLSMAYVARRMTAADRAFRISDDEWSRENVSRLFGARIETLGIPNYRWDALRTLAIALDVSIFDLVLPRENDPSVQWGEEPTLLDLAERVFGIPRHVVYRATESAWRSNARAENLFHVALWHHPRLVAAARRRDALRPSTDDEWGDYRRLHEGVLDIEAQLREKADAPRRKNQSPTLRAAIDTARNSIWQVAADGSIEWPTEFVLTEPQALKILAELGLLDDSEEAP